MHLRLFFALAWLAAAGAAADGDPFSVTAGLRPSGVHRALLTVAVRIPPGYRLYADDFKVETTAPAALADVSLPAPAMVLDTLAGTMKPVYTSDFTAVYGLTESPGAPALPVRVSYLGCDDAVCFLPQTREFNLPLPAGGDSAGAAAAVMTGAPERGPAKNVAGDWTGRLARFETRALRAGYMPAEDFLQFLDVADGARAAGEEQDDSAAKNYGWFVVLILLGGLALNLTPCVLPMIPVNLAIIGAGAGAGKDAAGPAAAGARRRGFALGSLYGLGITLAYGTLGAVVVLTGSVFGSVNASPWFNFAVAVLFLGLALAMFDVWTIDFSRWQARLAFTGGGRLAIVLMGAVSAILAGACVAPVVLTVLTQSLVLYAGGARAAGLALPFVLGLGMALPWPLAGAGLAALPRPGRWMNNVKRVFGVIILLLAGYYAWLGWGLLPARAARESARNAQAALAEGWLTDLPAALELAEREGRPLLVDFWASWCKNCMAMEATTLKHPEVRERLQDFVLLKYQAERPDQPPAQAVLPAFKVVGLPTYVILAPPAGSASAITPP